MVLCFIFKFFGPFFGRNKVSRETVSLVRGMFVLNSGDFCFSITQFRRLSATCSLIELTSDLKENLKKKTNLFAAIRILNYEFIIIGPKGLKHSLKKQRLHFFYLSVLKVIFFSLRDIIAFSALTEHFQPNTT